MSKDEMTKEQILELIANEIGFAGAAVISDHDERAFAVFRRFGAILGRAATENDARLVLAQIVRGFQENGGDFFFLPDLFGTCKKVGILRQFCPDLVFVSLAEPNGEEGFRFQQHRQKLVGRNENGKIVIRTALNIAHEIAQQKAGNQNRSQIRQ